MTATRQRVKYLYDVIDRRAGFEQPPLLAVSIHHGVVPRSTLTDDLPRAEDLSNYKLCNAGDLVLNRMRAFQGAIGISPQRGLVSPDYMVLRPSAGIEARFLHHLFRSTWFVGEMAARLRGIGGTDSGMVRTPRINPEDLGEISINLPPLDEQRRIADFLDVETLKIDNLTGHMEKANALLKERDIAFIDSRLARLRRSDIVPVSSVCSRIVDCVNKTAPLSETETPYRMIRTSNVRNGAVDFSDTFCVDQQTFAIWNRRGAPKRGDILLTREAPMGQVGILDTDLPCFLGQRIVLYRADPARVNNWFLLFNLMSTTVDEQLGALGAGSLHPHMRVGDCLKLKVYQPPLQKQLAIAAEISESRRDVDRISMNFGRQMSVLTERRQALITAAVTGQIDVTTARGVDVP